MWCLGVQKGKDHGKGLRRLDHVSGHEPRPTTHEASGEARTTRACSPRGNRSGVDIPAHGYAHGLDSWRVALAKKGLLVEEGQSNGRSEHLITVAVVAVVAGLDPKTSG